MQRDLLTPMEERYGVVTLTYGFAGPPVPVGDPESGLPDPDRIDGATRPHDGAGDFAAWRAAERAVPRTMSYASSACPADLATAFSPEAATASSQEMASTPGRARSGTFRRPVAS